MTLHSIGRALFDQTVTVKTVTTGVSFYGDPSVSTSASTYAARVEGKQHLVKGPDGRDVLARTVVYVGTTSTGGTPSGIGVNDLITLPDGSTPPILAVDTMRDGNSVHHAVVHCG